MPLKIGNLSEPFPYIEEQEKITYNTLKVLYQFEYPLQISTKNPLILSKYYSDFENPNWVIAVSLCSIKEKDLDKIEPSAPDLQSRLEGIRALTSQNASVFFKDAAFYLSLCFILL